MQCLDDACLRKEPFVNVCDGCYEMTCAKCMLLVEKYMSGSQGDSDEWNYHCYHCAKLTANAAAFTFLLIARFRKFANDKQLPPELTQHIAQYLRVR